MLNKLLHVFGRVFGILMGWRRTHRPGDLTARIFSEHDRLIARLAQSIPVPLTRQISKFKSRLIPTPDIKAVRVTIRGERISLIANRAVQRIAETDKMSGKRDSRRVVWLSSARNTAQVAAQTKTTMHGSTNIVKLHKQVAQLKVSKSEAA